MAHLTQQLPDVFDALNLLLFVIHHTQRGSTVSLLAGPFVLPQIELT